LQGDRIYASRANTVIHAADNIGVAATPFEVSTDGELELRARKIYVGMTPITAGKPIALSVAGPNGTLAEEVDLGIVGAGKALLHTFMVGNGLVTTDSAHLLVRQGRVGNYANFATPYFTAASTIWIVIHMLEWMYAALP